MPEVHGQKLFLVEAGKPHCRRINRHQSAAGILDEDGVGQPIQQQFVLLLPGLDLVFEVPDAIG